MGLALRIKHGLAVNAPPAFLLALRVPELFFAHCGRADCKGLLVLLHGVGQLLRIEKISARGTPHFFQGQRRYVLGRLVHRQQSALSVFHPNGYRQCVQ